MLATVLPAGKTSHRSTPPHLWRLRQEGAVRRSPTTASPCHLLCPPSSPLTSQHGVLVLGCADEACDPFDDLAFGLQVLLFWLLAQEHHWGPRTDRTNVRMSLLGPGWEPSPQGWTGLSPALLRAPPLPF